jgi:beta-phosphoglucomutase-like phosphatase (HAD superfamily)
MTTQIRHLRLAALNIDGVLLNDTFSPVIHGFLTRRGAPYTADVERRIFSQPQQIAGREIAATLGVDLASEEIMEQYFEERRAFLTADPVQLNEGAIELVRRVRALGLRAVCYGGLGKEHFDTFLGAYTDLFDGPGYVCTNDFRPGIHEIATEVFGLKHDQLLVVDDVARVAEAAQTLNMPFIGHPSPFEHSFQRQLMEEAGVRHIVDSLDDIDETLLRTLDTEAAAGTVWRE